MFGSLRFLLAYLVILSHLVGTLYVAHFGYYAVRGFFVISGFMMTAALNEVYAFDGLRFWTNRALRLLPPYYFVCLLTLAAIALAPEQASAYLKFWRGVPSLDDLLANAGVLPLQLTYTSFRLIPPYWSVAIEIDMYLMLFLITSRRMEWALLTLVAGLTVQLVSFHDFAGWGFNYFTAPAGVLPFAIGAVLYFLRRRGLPTAAPRAAG
ncbi:acyltransferase family protein, partial [Bradyrhizobium sp.]|uniref:acyltransferase family protein n=1 Tax=Bradyrhizobium sp. TaxID=376 RepID=UPI003C472CD5